MNVNLRRLAERQQRRRAESEAALRDPDAAFERYVFRRASEFLSALSSTSVDEGISFAETKIRVASLVGPGRERLVSVRAVNAAARRVLDEHWRRWSPLDRDRPLCDDDIFGEDGLSVEATDFGVHVRVDFTHALTEVEEESHRVKRARVNS